MSFPLPKTNKPGFSELGLLGGEGSLVEDEMFICANGATLRPSWQEPPDERI